jgi:hypothetical protein
MNMLPAENAVAMLACAIVTHRAAFDEARIRAKENDPAVQSRVLVQAGPDVRVAPRQSTYGEPGRRRDRLGLGESRLSWWWAQAA